MNPAATTARAGIVVLATILALVTLVTPAEAAVQHRWQGHAPVCVERHVNKYWGISNAVRTWNSVDAGQPKLYLRKTCPDTRSVRVRTVWRPKWPYGGMTWVSRMDGKLLHVEIQLNNAAPGRSRLDPDNARRWKRHAAVHEFGHALGLHHNDHAASVMSHKADCYAMNGTIGRIDRRNLHRLY